MFFDNDVNPVVDNMVANEAANVLFPFLNQVAKKQSWLYDHGISSHLRFLNGMC